MEGHVEEHMVFGLVTNSKKSRNNDMGERAICRCLLGGGKVASLSPDTSSS